MKNKKALWKNIFREIWKTKARFLSIFAIILLGVAFYAGIRATGPDMIDTANHYYDEQNLMDVRVLSTYGLNDDDLELLEGIGNATIEPGYSQDVVFSGSSLVARILSFPVENDNPINQYTILSGRLPEASGEIALDVSLEEDYALGDTVTFETEEVDPNPSDNFHTLSYEVVGFVKSPQYIENMARGNTTIGSGTLDGFAIVPEEDFDQEVYSEAYLTFPGTDDLVAYSEEYEEQVDTQIATIEETFEGRPAERLEELQNEIQAEIDSSREEIENAKEELADGQQQLDEAQAELDEGWAEYELGLAEFETEMANAQEAIDSGRQELVEAREEIAANRASLTSAQQELEENLANFQNRQAEAQEQIENGESFLENAREVLQVPRENFPESTRAALIEAAAPFDQNLADLFTGYFNGTVPAATVENALVPVEDSLAQTRAQLAAAEQELAQAQQEINQGWQELENAEAEVAAGEAELNEAQAQLDMEHANAEAELEDTYQELVNGQEEYEEALAEFESERADAEQEIAEGEAELEEAQADMEAMELPEYMVFDRTVNPGYAEYSDNAERISAIAQIFPLFFFLIAALVSLTTMTRMVDEQRTQIGTMKALGYSNGDISKKFLVYALLAGVGGTVLGLWIGYNLFPTVIFDAYGSLYNLPDVRISHYLSYSLLSFLVALLCTGVTALVAVRVELQSNAAILLRPKAPTIGKRILMERITPIWKRLSFTQKVTARNLLRYKRRMLMTVLGVAGCTALILTGFGLSDSISGIESLQFGKINRYEAIVGLNTDASESEVEEYNQTIESAPEITSEMNVLQENFTVEASGVNSQDVTLFVPETADNFDQFVLLNDRASGETYSLSANGVMVTEKFAELFSLESGDSFTLMDADNEEFEVTVEEVVENYLGHTVYMHPDMYEELFAGSQEVNTQLLNYNESESWEQELGSTLTSHTRVAGVNFVTQVSSAFADTLGSLGIVTIVLVVSAASLAFIVLYNLTNINVSERIRELSTIKVLGFYDKEVTMYIYRENILLTLMGIIVGFLLGVIMHQFVLGTAEIDMMMFSPAIQMSSYVYSAFLTFLFSGIVMLAMHYKLKNVDMLEALKTLD